MFGRNLRFCWIYRKNDPLNHAECIAREQGRALYCMICLCSPEFHGFLHACICIFCKLYTSGFYFLRCYWNCFRFQVVPCITADIAIVPLGCCHRPPQMAAHPVNRRNLCLVALEADSLGWGTSLAGWGLSFGGRLLLVSHVEKRGWGLRQTPS